MKAPAAVDVAPDARTKGYPYVAFRCGECGDYVVQLFGEDLLYPQDTKAHAEASALAFPCKCEDGP